MSNRSIPKAACGCIAALALAGAAPAALADSSGKWQSGKEVYDKVCGYCHESGVGPVIRGRELPAEYIRYVVRHGNRAMPSFRPSEIGDDALAEVVRLVSGKQVQ
ncbi:MAG: cytochrome c [Burkholderiaceae bacterium]|nr:cytochrome c [Burkholderiaceae bacterium]